MCVYANITFWNHVRANQPPFLMVLENSQVSHKKTNYRFQSQWNHVATPFAASWNANQKTTTLSLLRCIWFCIIDWLYNLFWVGIPKRWPASIAHSFFTSHRSSLSLAVRLGIPVWMILSQCSAMNNPNRWKNLVTTVAPWHADARRVIFPNISSSASVLWFRQFSSDLSKAWIMWHHACLNCWQFRREVVQKISFQTFRI